MLVGAVVVVPMIAPFAALLTDRHHRLRRPRGVRRLPGRRAARRRPALHRRLWWFTNFLRRASYVVLLPVLVVTGLIGAGVLYAQRTVTVEREGGLLRAKDEARAATSRALPALEQQALLAERQEIVAVLVEHGLVDEAMARRVLEMPLGDWRTSREESPTR